MPKLYIRECGGVFFISAISFWVLVMNVWKKMLFRVNDDNDERNCQLLL